MRWLKIKQIDRKISSYRSLIEAEPPQEGWIKAIREALGITLDQVAKKLGVQKSTINFHERSEQKHTITLHTLEQIAGVLGCRLVYALIPERDLEDVLKQRMKDYVNSELDALSHSMLLEEQKTNSDHIKIEKQVLLDQLMRQKNISKIWEDSK